MRRSQQASGRAGRRAVAARAVVVAVVLLGPAGCGSDEPGAGAGAGAATDWRTTTYTLTCDDVVPGGFRADVVDGRARVPADAGRPPYYDHYEVAVVSTAEGDVDGDGRADTVVLLECSPQPSNGVLQEVLVLSSAGRPLGALPSPRTLQGEAPLPPLYDPAGLSVVDGEIVARMTAYAPEDSRADGPSLPITVRWRHDDGGFERIAPT